MSAENSADDLDRFIEGITDPLYVQGYRNGYARAEAEVAELRATVARCVVLADAHTGTHDLDCECNDWAVISPNEVRTALDGAGEQHD